MKNSLFYSLFLGASLSVLVSQPALAQVTQITDIEFKSTDKGLQVILVTPNPKNVLSLPRKFDNTYKINIPNMQLSLPCGNIFRRENPDKGIQSISVTNQDTNSIHLVVVGETRVPKVMVAIGSLRTSCVKCNLKYPEELKQRGIEGRAEAVFDLDQQGNVTNANIGSSSGNTEVDNAVLTQVREMKFANNACGRKNVQLRANFIIPGSAFHRQLVEEYKKRLEEERQQQLRRQVGRGAALHPTRCVFHAEGDRYSLDRNQPAALSVASST